jgi:hypothetical protein
MTDPTRRWIQTALAIALAIVSVRTAWILYSRQAMSPARPTPHAFVNADAYVYPPRAYLSDFASALKLKGTTVWVRDGYRYADFPFDPVHGRTVSSRERHLLAPIKQLTIAEVTREPSRKAGLDEVNIVFQDETASPPLRSASIGACQRDSCRFYFDEMFFLKDPRQLYAHWDAATWQAIERHEVREGMTEAQISFALGYGLVVSDGRGARGAERVLEFRPPDSPPIIVNFDSHGFARFIQTLSMEEKLDTA